MMEKYRDINNKLINYYENIHDEKNLKKHLIVRDILKNEACFFKMSIDEAFSILKDLKITNVKQEYQQLISPSNYQKLRKKNLL